METESIEHAITTRWALLLVLLCSVVVRLSTLNDPFTRNHESTASGPMVGAARNMVRYGFLECHFGYVMNTDRVDPEFFTYYNHHPPLVPIIMAISAKICGDQPWSYRLPSAICSVLAAGLLFVMLSRKFDWRIGLATALLYSLCPFSWMYGDMPDVVGPPLMFFGLATIESYSRWSDTRRALWLYFAIAAWFLAALCDWPAFFLIPVLSVHYLLNNPVRRWWPVIPVGFVAAIFLGALIGWLTLGGDKSVVSQLVHRMNGPTDSGFAYSTRGWWKLTFGSYVYDTFTLPVMILFFAYVVSLILTARSGRRGFSAHDTALIMLAWGLMHVFVGMQSSYQHMWVWCVLLPGACAAAALGGFAAWQWLPARITARPVTRYSLAAIAVCFLIGCYLKAKFLSDQGLPVEQVSYTMEDFGKVIRESVPPGQGVLTSDIGDPVTGLSEPALWYYSDRQLRNGIRTVQQLDNSLGEGNYQLYEGFIQHGGPAPMWFIMPCEHHDKLKELASALDTRYARWQSRGFLIYYLRWTPADAARDPSASAR